MEINFGEVGEAGHGATLRTNYAWRICSCGSRGTDLYVGRLCPSRIREFTTTVEKFDPQLELWTKLPTRGSPPIGICKPAIASKDHYIYIYGGVYPRNPRGQCQGSIHRLDVHSCTWTLLSPYTLGGPLKKNGCEMVCYEDELVLFGGCTGDPLPTFHTQPDVDYDACVCWYFKGSITNELHIFHLNEGNDYIGSS